MLLDAQVEGLEASDVKPGVERGRNRAGRVLQEGHRVACFLVVQDHRAADHVRVAADVLGGGVDDHVGAVCERMLQYRGCEGVVHDHFGAVRVRHGRGGGDVGDVEQRVGRGLHPDIPILLAGKRRGNGGGVGDVHHVEADAPRHEHLGQQTVGAAVHVVAEQDVVAGLQGGAQQHVDGGKSGGEA